jgi:hypothetical protein
MELAISFLASHALLCHRFLCGVLGLIVYALFVCFLCRLLARGKREEERLSDFHSRIERFHKTHSQLSPDQRSDCPALSAILARLTAVAGFEPGMSISIPNSPHRPLVLELAEPMNPGAPPLLRAHHYSSGRLASVYEYEMTFEVIKAHSQCWLKAVEYQPVRSEYLAAFALMWSRELLERGYVEAELPLAGIHKIHRNQDGVPNHTWGIDLTQSHPQFRDKQPSPRIAAFSSN